ncbi:MAG: hypothetical protein ACTSPB_22085 [Candidatus Thorarchaeota archaeon]
MVNYMVAFNEGRPVEEVMTEQGQVQPPTPPPDSGTPGSEPEAAGGSPEGWQNLSEVTEEGEEVGEATPETPPEAPTPETQAEAVQPDATDPAEEESTEPETVQSQSV